MNVCELQVSYKTLKDLLKATMDNDDWQIHTHYDQPIAIDMVIELETLLV